VHILWHYLNCATVSLADHIECSGQQCANTLIHCSPNDDCHVSCRDTDSCKHSIINCPLHGNCFIECLGEHSCQNTVIDASSSEGSLDLICGSMGDENDGDENCHSVIVYGSTNTNKLNTSDDDTRSFNVLCSDNHRSCMAAQFHCSVHSQCSIACNGFESCSYADVIGTSLDSMQVYCNDDRSCFHSQIHAVTASQLRIQGCMEHESCQYLSIFCPPHTDGVKHCSLLGSDNDIHEADDEEDVYLQELLIYALNGWNDIDIGDNNGTIVMSSGGRMHCGERYAETCVIGSDSWSCVDDSISHHLLCTANVSNDPRSTAMHTTNTPPWDLQTSNVVRNEYVHTEEDGDQRTGELMIVGGVMLALLTCILVGWAKYVKQCRDKAIAQHSRGRRRRKKHQNAASVDSSPHESMEIRIKFNGYKSKQKQKNVSRTHGDEVLQKAMNKLSIVIENEEKKALPVHRY